MEGKYIMNIRGSNRGTGRNRARKRGTCTRSLPELLDSFFILTGSIDQAFYTMNISFYNENSAKNALKIEVNHVSFFFSYNTLVGVQYIEPNNLLRTAVRENQW